MDQASVKPPTPAQNSNTLPVPANPPTPTVDPSDEGVFEAAPYFKGGTQLGAKLLQYFAHNSWNLNNDLTHVSINDKNACQRKGSDSATIGAL